MWKYYFSLINVIFLASGLRGQEVSALEGVVSFKSSQNIYLKFSSTQPIKVGDTIYIKQDVMDKPAIVVQHLSSISCMGTILPGVNLEVGDQVIHYLHSTPVQAVEEQVVQAPSTVITPKMDSLDKKLQDLRVQKLYGRISVANYTNMSSLHTNDSERMRYTFNLDVKNLNGSKFSFQNYITFNHTMHHWQEVMDNFNNALKIYNLAVDYEVTPSFKVSAGRKINRYISNVGAIDGLQVEKRFGDFFVGAVSGTRPDYQDYSFNPNLFQFGGYIGQDKQTEHGYLQTTFGMMEQKNHGLTDRRFAYFQHSNMLVKNVSLFTSFEIDLFENVDNKPVSTFNLSSVYLSLRYRVNRNLSLSGSYDARKNIIYYESYKSFIDQLIEDETRQGLRFNVNYRPFKYVSIGANAGYRFQASNTQASKNAYGYISYSQVPWIKASATASVTLLQTPYINGLVYGLRLNKDFFEGKFYAEFEGRKVDYQYGQFESALQQNILGTHFTWRILRKLSLSLSYEGTFESNKSYTRMYANLIKRF
ncbi:MAG: hypothetical protein R2806_19770 [Saprospiraceae bacterium]